MSKILVDKDVLEQALEALVSENSLSAVAMQQRMDAITALRAALAEPVLNPAPGYCKHCKQYTIEEPLPAEPVQEPVAWRTFDGEGGYDYWAYEDNENYHEEYVKRNGEKYASWVEPLYTAPPQRKPLTEEEIRDLWSWAMTAEAERTATTQQHAFARAIERAHGIKE